MMRLGIYGGTFNPVHNGHLRLAQTYRQALRLDRLLVIPAKRPPHKSDQSLVSGEHRLNMCRLAFPPGGFEVSDLELCRKSRKSYTVDTLEMLKKEHPDARLYLIMGSDMFFTLTEWREWRRVFELAVMCAGSREADLRKELLAHKAYLENLGARCRLVDLDPLVISSTRIRAMAHRGEDITPFVPPAVAEYISDRGLYREGGMPGRNFLSME